MGKSRKNTVSRKRPTAFAAVLGRRIADGGIRIGKGVEANFRAWYERNFVNCRAGRIGNMSYGRAGALDDRPGDRIWYADAHARAWSDYNAPLDSSELAYIVSHPLVAFQLSVGITDLRGLRCLRRGLTLRTNRLQQKAYRSRYYERDNARRRLLAAERRKIRKRTTTNPCPTPEGFRAAFARVGESAEAKVLFGGMVHDLACYVDSCLMYDDSGNIVGRNGGIKKWLADNVPELFPRYKTIMRYKALAMRLRQAMDVRDPEPTSALLEDSPAAGADNRYDAARRDGGTQTGPSGRARKVGVGGNKNYYALNSHSDGGDGDGNSIGNGRYGIGVGNRRGKINRGDGSGDDRSDEGGNDVTVGCKHVRQMRRQRRERLRRLLAYQCLRL